MKVLAIETSCDETAAAVVMETGKSDHPWSIRSNVVASQVDVHREWGGVVPELASRQHVRDICGVVDRAMSDANTEWPEFDAIAVTQGPGLIGSLLVGVAFAKAIATSLDIPLIPVHHLAGHIESLVVDLCREYPDSRVVTVRRTLYRSTHSSMTRNRRAHPVFTTINIE